MRITTLFTCLSVLLFCGVSVSGQSDGSQTEAYPTDPRLFYMQDIGIADDPDMDFVTGTHFESSDTDVVVDTSAEVTMMLEATDQDIAMYIDEGGDSTTFTVSGMAPWTVYYLYKDSYLDVTVITTDTTGSYTFTLDTSDKHYVWFQLYPSTVVISDLPGGGGCFLVGTWDPVSKTCELTQDLTESVQMNSSGITLDCAGHKITGSGGSNGVLIPALVTGVAITKCEISAFDRGIFAVDSGGFHTFTSNNIHNMVRDGIFVLRSGGSNTVLYNVISNVNEEAITFARGGGSNTVQDNMISDVNEEAIVFSRGGGSNTVQDNIISDINLTAILFVRNEGLNTIQDNVISNVNSDAIFFVFNEGSNTVQDNVISNASRGIRIFGTGDFNVIDSNSIEVIDFGFCCHHGILLQGTGPFPPGPFVGSSNNEITNNDISSVGGDFGTGIFIVFGSNENTIHSNNIFVDRPDSNGRGISFDVQANGNIVTSNTVDFANGGIGIGMESGSGVGCDDLYVSDNSITGATQPFVILLGEGNIIEDNDIENSGASRLWGGSDNVFRNNEIEDGMNVGNGLCAVGDVCQVVFQIDCNLDMGIHVNGETGTVVTENTVDNVVGEGIVVSDLVREKLDTNPPNLAQCYGFPFEFPPVFDPPMFETLESIDNTISSNDIEASGGNGIELTGSNNNDVTDNEIQEIGGNGILLDSSNSNLVTDNEIEECGGQGILEVGASAGNVFANNEVEDCP